MENNDITNDDLLNQIIGNLTELTHNTDVNVDSTKLLLAIINCINLISTGIHLISYFWRKGSKDYKKRINNGIQKKLELKTINDKIETIKKSSTRYIDDKTDRELQTENPLN